MKPAATYELLVDGVGQWDFTGNFVPCELLLTGDAAFPVLVSPEKQVLIAVSHYGKGRMVVVSHEEILKNPNFSQFLRNAVDWLRPSPEAQVGVHRSLDPLSQLLLRSSTKVQPGVGLSASLGVYCTDAYDDAQAEELVHFVKGGGGLLMGGQAWYWASQHSAEKVLFEFPGNRVTSVAGVYFTGNTVGSGIFKVSGKIPKIPLIVPHGANLSQDAELLLKGVSELDIVTGGVPSQLLVHGVLAFPLGLDSSHRCFLAAARYGRGRVVVASHEGQLCAPKLAGFLLNTINWLDAGRQGLVGVAAHLKGLCSLLSQEDWKYQVSALTSDMSVYCCPSHSDQEAEKIQAFVAEGGGLLIGGQAWYWSSQNQGQAAVAGYPGNKILNRFGISILGMNLKADKYPALLPGELPRHYHFRQALSLFQRHVGDKEEALRAPLADWLHRLGQDCSAFLRIPAEDCPAYSSLHRILLKVLHRGGIPQVSKKNPIKSNSKEAALLCLATQLSQTMTDCAVLVQKPTDGVCTLPSTSLITLEIDGTNTGETCKCQWLASIRHYPAPWAELATENIILTVSADSIRHIENPEPLLTLWDQIMMAIAELAAAPAKFPRPERIVTDVQISAGWMHAGYPIMGHLDSVKEMVNVEHMRATGLWGPIHELGHNQQRAGWEFPPHTTEATCNLWSVYVHEKVLGIPRDRAHQALQPQCRKQRVTGYLEKGAQLKDWSMWTALETYLQLQEGFGWEPFILLFSDYQKMSNIPKDNPSKMNLWAEKFSRQVNKNLAPFFLAWGWPIKEDVSLELATLPNWEENPMKLYRPGKK
ncbi:TRPM8 channel-associated factor 2-like isoform X2 [Gopherus flavomarginatus]|uniref:TRPM8 channel-associated factor 2-like isoform X2 n=1 Tax=Gopherus flavomarginatus TaxID=286002 RepID=UPI0021CC3BD6|nr:TRPM8 channel-associated factor 2-like isoform X2 [Gopherus flavomarginatus]